MEPVKNALVPVVVDLNERRRRHKPVVRGKIVDAVTVYRCAHCKDAGYLRANVPFGHPKFGKAIECECLLAKRKADRLK